MCGIALEVIAYAMKILRSASIALSLTLLVACDRDTTAAAPRELAAVPDDQAKPKPVNATAPAPAAPAGTQPGVNAQGAATLEFQKRIQAYMKIHNDAEGKVPNLKKTDDPKEISDREKALGQMIMTLRAGAKPGDIFAPEYQPFFIKIVQDDFKARSAAARKALVVELPKNLKVDINTVYPTTLPLETFPPMLLRKLPDLPPELEYRIVARSLILRDVKANLIVDILRDVVPTIPS
jgi:hypothetical protein